MGKIYSRLYTVHIKFYQNQPSFVEDMTKNILAYFLLSKINFTNFQMMLNTGQFL